MFMGITNKGQIQVHVSSAHFLFEVQVHGLQLSSRNACQHLYAYSYISLILLLKTKLRFVAQ